jgi:hypothetical protein
MKKLLCLLTLVAMTAYSLSALAYVTVRYHNKDSKSYVANAVCHGSKYKVKFGSSRTASVTIQGSSPCKVTLGSSTLTLSGGERLEIKNGKMIKK